MEFLTRFTPALGLFAVLGLPGAAAMDALESGAPIPPRSRPGPGAAEATRLLDGLPVSFERNMGQRAGGGAYFARGRGWVADFDAAGVIFRLDGRPRADTGFRVRGVQPGIRVDANRPYPGVINYLRGRDPSRWVTGVPHFAGLRTREVLPGVALRWQAVSGGRVRYDFELAAGTDPSSVVLDFHGADSLHLERNGALLASTAAGSIRHSRPVAWQERPDGVRLPVRCDFRVTGSAVGLRVDGRDPALPLVIDPTIDVSTLFALGSNSLGRAAEFDASGNLFVAGFSNTEGLATTGVLQEDKAAYDDTIIAKLPKGASSFAWLTYFGGDFDDRCHDLALADDGTIWIAGATWSTDLPLQGAFQESIGSGNPDAFLARIGASGATLVSSTYYGGNGDDSCYALALDSDGRPWIGGWSSSSDLDLEGALDSTTQSLDGYLALFSEGGDELVFATFLGGSSGDGVFDIAVSPDGSLWCAGSTSSSDFPLVDAVQSNYGGAGDAFLAAVAADRGSFAYSSFLGGSGQDTAYGVGVDSAGDAFVAGGTVSSNFPTVSAFQAANGAGATGGLDGFFQKLDASTKTVVFASYLGGAEEDRATAAVVDGDGRLVLAGITEGAGFPTTDPTDASFNGQTDLFLTVVAPDGQSLTFSTFHGGSNGEEPYRVACRDGRAVMLGRSNSTNFPRVNAVTNQTGGFPAFFVVIAYEPAGFEEFRASGVFADRVELDWTDPHDGEYAPLLQRRTPGGEFETLAELDPGTELFVDYEVSENAEYEYRIRGVSNDVTAWSAIVPVLTPIHAPGSLAASAPNNGQVDLTWVDLSAVEVQYEIFRRTPPGEFASLATKPAGSTSATDSTVAPETAYEYYVRTTGAGDSFADSAAVPATTPPANPSGIGAQGVTDVVMRVTWVDNSGSEQSYEAQRRDDDAGGEFTTVASRPAGSTMFLDAGVVGEHSYSWRVRAVNQQGASGWSAVASATTPPRAPTGLSVDPLSPESARIAWNDNSDVEQSFSVERRLAGSGEFVAVGQTTADVTEWVDADVSQDTAYQYRVRAAGVNGTSRAPEEVTGRTPSQIVIKRVLLRGPLGKRPALLKVQGTLDSGAPGIDWSQPCEFDLAGVELDIPGFTPRGRGFRYEADGVRVDLKSTGPSETTFTITLTGDVPAGLAHDALLTLRVRAGAYSGMGTAAMEEGAFDPVRGVGSWQTPSLTVSSVRVSGASPGTQRLNLAARFVPPAAPWAQAPDLRLRIGGGAELSLDGASFEESSGKWLLRIRDGTSIDAVLDPAKGSIMLKGSRLDLLSIPGADSPVRIEFSVGDLQFVDDPVVRANGKSLKY